MGEHRSWLSLLVVLGVAGCANLYTIERTTSLPIEASKDPVGKAIHLDAQQRLVIYRAGKYCAEPSPDAMAAYAASLGLGLSIPGRGAGSLSQAQQSAIASIGLRTQSITLMRDALYRMCEAYHNGQLGETHVVTLLARSQDLTAVVLAVEQLTGAVAANQAALTGTAGSSAAASLVSNQQLLDAARKNEQAKLDALEASKKDQAAAKTALDTAKADEAKAKGDYDTAVASGSTTPAAEQARLKQIWQTKQADTTTAQGRLDRAEAAVVTNTKLHAEAKTTREVIEASRDAALTSAMAETSSSAQFSTPVARVLLSEAATKEIALSVSAMVTKVLDKSYLEDSCMALLTGRARSPEEEAALLGVKAKCMDLIGKAIERAILRSNFVSASFGSDANSAILQREIDRDPAFLTRLQTWLGSSISAPVIIYGSEAEYSAKRKEAVEHFNLK